MAANSLNWNDAELVGKFSSVFSEKFFNTITRSLVYNAYCTEETRAILEGYANGMANTSAKYSNMKAKKVAPRSTRRCSSSWTSSASISRSRPRIAEKPPGKRSYHLLPKVSQKFCGHPQTDEERAQWNERKRELDALMEKFEIEYREMAWVARSEFAR